MYSLEYRFKETLGRFKKIYGENRVGLAHVYASGCLPEQKVRKGQDIDFAIADIAANEWRDIFAPAFGCDALSRPHSTQSV